MNKLFLFFGLLLFNSFHIEAQQQLSSKATVSVITCGPGNELYSTFGHSAFRIHDASLGIDKVYNYGTFDFNAPNFYLNFAKGQLTYQLSTSSFSRFLRAYQYENRWVKTQELNLTSTEVQATFNFLENNATPENRDYQYDFFYDNCSTKIEDILKHILNDKVTFSNSHISSNKTHRDLITDYTVQQKWSKFGIDLALGSVIDDKATKDEYKFLPDYVFEAFNNATIKTKNGIQPIVKKERTILTVNKNLLKSKNSIVSRPFFVLLFISLLLIFITFKNKTSKRTKWLDFSIFFSTGIIGIVVLLLWFATSHTATYKNLNFLWAFAPNLLVSFYMFKLKLPNWVKQYNYLLMFLLALTIIVWIAKIQIFNFAILPLILALGFRYWYLATLKK
ncbi:MAG: DUF4105 domain-containing protein [Lutibacter sp.]|uniref:Lnb N-terminal periplasmic domain-containing protein n=1 Tax=Lutibacter sp. TaxID=1925666 RepID=UPI001A05B126|nr:DUF4105 domain-containing protein [Lutibacter sp.]NOR28992.1 DUF4105 domain-containing protein [Lutibacter sp.]